MATEAGFAVVPVGRVRSGRDDPADNYATPLRPRGRADLPEVGVFCDRGPRRPNRLGVTTCRVMSAASRVLRVAGLDAVVGTPVLDVKPAMRQFTASDVRQPPWVGRLMSAYFLDQPGEQVSRGGR